MPYITNTANSKFRLLISGFPNTGKTTSLPTFIYGPYDCTDQVEEAYKYADNKHMVIISCPGETGTRSLPLDTPHITSCCYQADEKDDMNSLEWSAHALDAFDTISTEVVKNKPDILFLDGLHCLWSHLMNRTTDGEFLSGFDLNWNPTTNRTDPYRSAKFYNRTHNAFGQYLAGLYNSSVPFIGATTWEEWESGTAEGMKAGDIAATRYLWPAIPGGMAKGIVGRFDARVSARLERQCLHRDCIESKNQQYHHVWQIYPKNDVQGVGIKGLKITEQIKQKPWVHQSWDKLQMLMQQFS